MNGMKLHDADLLRLLPQFMQEDETVQALAASISSFIRELAASSPVLRKWDAIDAMSEELLDELAWELNVLWYDPAADLETKRRLIRNSDRVYSTLGTKWAVEEVVATYLGDATVSEWFEYGGRPHYFKVYSNNNNITSELEATFLRALEIVKRKSQWLEAIVLSMEEHGAVYTGMVAHEHAVETAEMYTLAWDSEVKAGAYVGMVLHEVQAETVTMTAN